MRHLLLGILLAGCAVDGPDGPPVELPPCTTSIRGEPVADGALTVTLTADGRIDAGDGWRTLAGLAEFVRPRLKHDAGPFGSSTPVRLRIDRGAPCRHVQWLLGCLANATVRFARLVHAGGDAEIDLAADLYPAGAYLLPAVQKGPAVTLRIAVDDDGRLRCGRRSTDDPAKVLEWIVAETARVPPGPRVAVLVEVVATEAAPWGPIAAIYEIVRHAEVDSVSLPGYVFPTDATLRLGRLPRPERESTEGLRSGVTVASSWFGRFAFSQAAPGGDADGIDDEPEPEIPLDPR